MQFGVYEFEVFQDEGVYVALPFDLEGGTQGRDFSDACKMIADWLRITIEDYDIRGMRLPQPTFGNAPHYGGKIVLVGVAAGRETIEKVPAAEAARRLGVSPGRVSQMLRADLLEGWREGARTWVTVASLEARLADRHRAGRPRREAEPASPESRGFGEERAGDAERAPVCAALS